VATNKMYLGNLSWGTTEESLSAFLRDEGFTFKTVKLILDHNTNKSRGFAFVEFETPEAVTEAIAALDGTIFDRRPLRASEAEEKRKSGGSIGENRPDRDNENQGDWRRERGHRSSDDREW